MRDRLRCRSIPSPAVRERGDRPRSGWWERVVRIGAALGDESVGYTAVLARGSALVKLDAVECSVGAGAGDFLSWQKVTKSRVPAGRPDAGEPDRSASGASQRANARTRTSGPGFGFSEKVAPWMAGNRGPRVARRLPRSLDSVFRTSSSDPGWAFPGPAVMRTATCHWQVGRASPLQGHDPGRLVATRHRRKWRGRPRAMSRSDEPSMFPVYQRRSAGLGACSIAGCFEGAEPRAETVVPAAAEQAHHLGYS